MGRGRVGVLGRLVKLITYDTIRRVTRLTCRESSRAFHGSIDRGRAVAETDFVRHATHPLRINEGVDAKLTSTMPVADGSNAGGA
jgi:hypothetical protein